jgi:DNA-binding CsgD family transcriptional regulator
LHRDLLAEATAAASRALAAFDAPGLEYERARTLLVVGRIQRRRRERGNARRSLLEAAHLFTGIGAAGWAAHTRRELDQLGLQQTSDQELTPTEMRIATLAATGHTNAAVAGRLAISPKTVEAHLSRIYRKLGIHSRAELGSWLATVGRAGPPAL